MTTLVTRAVRPDDRSLPGVEGCEAVDAGLSAAPRVRVATFASIVSRVLRFALERRAPPTDRFATPP